MYESTLQTTTEAAASTDATQTTAVTEATEPAETEPAEQLIPGDVNDDGIVNASDAAQILIAAAKIGAGKPSDLSVRQWIVANVNYDGTVNASDAALVLVYAAYVGAGGTTSPIDYFLPPDLTADAPVP